MIIYQKTRKHLRHTALVHGVLRRAQLLLTLIVRQHLHIQDQVRSSEPHLIICARLSPSGLQSGRRPDGVLRRTHTRGSPHHARPRLWEPFPGEEVLLQHPLMTSRWSRAGAGIALPAFSVFTTPEATGRRHWDEFCQVDTLLLVSSVLVAEGFGGVGQTGNPVSVSCLVN